MTLKNEKLIIWSWHYLDIIAFDDELYKQNLFLSWLPFLIYVFGGIILTAWRFDLS